MPREFPRSRRIEEQIQRILGDALRTDMRDPRFDGVTVTAVKVSRDLGVAWIYYALLDPDARPEDAGTALQKGAGFLRHKLAGELQIRRVPELRFEYDDSGRIGRELEQLIDAAVERDRGSDDEPAADDDAHEPL